MLYPPLKPKRTALTPLFEVRGAKFNDETGYYELNGLVDLSEKEMIDIYSTANLGNLGHPFKGTLSYGIARTNFKGIYSTNNGYSAVIASNFCFNNNVIETIVAGGIVLIHNGSETPILDNCRKLREFCRITGSHEDSMWGDIRVAGGNVPGIFTRCPALEWVNVSGIRKSIRIFTESPLINYKSIRYLVDYSENKEPITITINSVTYSYLTGTAEPTEQVGGTKEEWMQLVTDATAKNITFITQE